MTAPAGSFTTPCRLLSTPPARNAPAVPPLTSPPNPLAGIGSATCNDVSRTGRADQAQITPDFIIQVALSDSHRGGRIELEILHLTAISHDRKVGHVNEVAFRILATAGFHAEQSSHGRTRAAVNHNARTTHSLQKSCSCYLLSKG